jgi:DNA repair protein RadC
MPRRLAHGASLAGVSCGCPLGVSAAVARDSGAGGRVRVRSAYPEIERRGKTVGPIGTPREAGWVLEPLGLLEAQEVACVMNLDVHSGFAGVREVGRGDIEHVDVPPHLAIRAANFNGTPWAILAHNHPSGSPTPSREDIDLWHDTRERFACAGLTLLDHLILGRGAFYSCKWAMVWSVGR